MTLPVLVFSGIQPSSSEDYKNTVCALLLIKYQHQLLSDPPSRVFHFKLARLSRNIKMLGWLEWPVSSNISPNLNKTGHHMQETSEVGLWRDALCNY